MRKTGPKGNPDQADKLRRILARSDASPKPQDGYARISPEMAIRLSKAFGGSPERWLIQQAQYALRQAQEEGEPDVEQFATP